MPLQERPRQVTGADARWGWCKPAPGWIFGSPPADDKPAASPGTLAAPTREAAGRLRVLVVEDNRDAADTLRDLLEGIGYQVAVAYTGTEGVSAALRCLPHVVLCDIGLPELDGYGVAATLKGDARTAQARLIAITGYNREEDLRRSKEAGFETHLVKPVDLDCLEHLLAGAAAAIPLHAAPDEEEPGT